MYREVERKRVESWEEDGTCNDRRMVKDTIFHHSPITNKELYSIQFLVCSEDRFQRWGSDDKVPKEGSEEREEGYSCQMSSL